MKNIKDQKGAIALFATLAMLFFLGFMLGAYELSSRRNAAQIEELKQVQNIYNSGSSANTVYDSLYTTFSGS